MGAAVPYPMSAPAAPSTPKFFKILLVAFPLGLIVLGAASFLLYFGKQQQAEERSSRYAAGLRRELNEADLARYRGIIETALAGAQRGPVISAFIESTLGPENMGYEVRVLPYYSKAEALPGLAAGSGETRKTLDAEVTGQKRRKELVLIATDYLPPLAAIPALRPSGVPALLSIAHACTGLVGARTLRFVAVPDVLGLAAWASDCRVRGDRLTHVALLGGLAALSDAEIHAAMGTGNEGIVLLRPRYDTLEAAQALKQQALDLTARE